MQHSLLRKWASSIVSACLLGGTMALPGCTDQDGQNLQQAGKNYSNFWDFDVHLHSDPNQTLTTTADADMQLLIASDSAATPAGLSDINALIKLQQTVDSANVDYSDSSSAYDAVNKTWYGLRGEFLQQVGLLDPNARTTTQQIDGLNDDLDDKIALRLTQVHAVADLLKNLIQAETNLADQAEKNLENAVSSVNATTQPSPGQALASGSASTSSSTQMTPTEIQQLVQLENDVLSAANGYVKEATQAGQLEQRQQTVQKLQDQLLSTIQSSRDSEAVSALVPLIGSGLDDASTQRLDDFISRLNSAINGSKSISSSAPGAAASPATTEATKKIREQFTDLILPDDVASAMGEASTICTAGGSQPFAVNRLNTPISSGTTQSDWSQANEQIKNDFLTAALVTSRLKSLRAQPASQPISESVIKETMVSACYATNFTGGPAGGTPKQNMQGTIEALAAPPTTSYSSFKPAQRDLTLMGISALNTSAQVLKQHAAHSADRRHRLSKLQARLNQISGAGRRQLRIKGLSDTGDASTGDQSLREALTFNANAPRPDSLYGIRLTVQNSIVQSLLGNPKSSSVSNPYFVASVAVAKTVDKSQQLTTKVQSGTATAKDQTDYSVQIKTYITDAQSAVDNLSKLHDPNADKLVAAFNQIAGKAGSIAGLLPSDAVSSLQDIIGSGNQSLVDLFSNKNFTGLLNETVLSASWLQNVLLAIDPKEAAALGSSSSPGALFNQETLSSLNGLSGVLTKILQGQTAARLDLVQEYLNKIYQSQVSVYQEQERHYKALSEIAQLEIKRWTILQEINQNVAVTFDGLNMGKGGFNAQKGVAGSKYYIPYEALPPGDFKAASQQRQSDMTIPAEQWPPNHAATKPSTRPTPITLREAQIDRMGGQDAEQGLAQFPPVPDDVGINKSSEVFASLRALAFAAKQRFDWKNSSDPAASLRTLSYQAEALAINQRLKDLVKLWNSCLLMNSVNLRFSLDDGRRLKQELLTHDFELDQLAAAVKEQNIQYYLDDLKMYHSGGITKEDIETVAQDVAQAAEATVITVRQK